MRDPAGARPRPPSILCLVMASKPPQFKLTGITAPAPAPSAEAGRSSSSVSTRWTRWCARRAVARCGSSRSLSTTMLWTRSCDTSRRPRRDLLAVHRVRQLSPPLREPISAAAAGAGCARSGGIWALDRGSGGAVPGRLSRPPVPADSGGCSACRYSSCGSRTALNVVLVCAGTKGISYPYIG